MRLTSVRPASASTYQPWTRISMCRLFWMAFWVLRGGWLPGWVKLAASRGVRLSRPLPEGTENLGAERRKPLNGRRHLVSGADMLFANGGPNHSLRPKGAA